MEGAHGRCQSRARLRADRRDVVVFIIGMRINKIWKVHKRLPVFFGMPRMLKELTET